MRSMAILLPIVRRAASAGPPLPTRARRRLAQLREGLEVRRAARRQMLDAAPNRGFSSDRDGELHDERAVRGKPDDPARRLRVHCGRELAGAPGPEETCAAATCLASYPNTAGPDGCIGFLCAAPF